MHNPSFRLKLEALFQYLIGIEVGTLVSCSSYEFQAVHPESGVSQCSFPPSRSRAHYLHLVTTVSLHLLNSSLFSLMFSFLYQNVGLWPTWLVNSLHAPKSDPKKSSRCSYKPARTTATIFSQRIKIVCKCGLRIRLRTWETSPSLKIHSPLKFLRLQHVRCNW
jgi:hypothetical protein